MCCAALRPCVELSLSSVCGCRAVAEGKGEGQRGRVSERRGSSASHHDQTHHWRLLCCAVAGSVLGAPGTVGRRGAPKASGWEQQQRHERGEIISCAVVEPAGVAHALRCGCLQCAVAEAVSEGSGGYLCVLPTPLLLSHRLTNQSVPGCCCCCCCGCTPQPLRSFSCRTPAVRRSACRRICSCQGA